MSETSELQVRERVAAAGTESLHAVLRRTTRPLHDGVEQLFERFDLTTREGLGGFLRRQAAAVLPLEHALETSGAGEMLADWAERRRADALREDLAVLGLEPPPSQLPPAFDTAPAILGALYVLEGSKLGGRVLCRRVLASPDPRVRAASRYLGHRGGAGWPAFLAVLDALPAEGSILAQATSGAAQAFACFHQAADAADPILAFSSTRRRALQPIDA